MPPVPKKTVTKPAPLLGADKPGQPEELAESTKDVTAAESESPAQEPVPGELEPATIDDPELTDTVLTEPDLVNVAVPCPSCYPEGWFEGAIEGARASCSHLTIVFGEFTELGRALAFELGYEDRSATS